MGQRGRRRRDAGVNVEVQLVPSAAERMRQATSAHIHQSRKRLTGLNSW